MSLTVPDLPRGGIESTVSIEDGTPWGHDGLVAVKTYSDRYHVLNGRYGRPQESFWYTRQVIPQMPKFIDATPETLVLAYAGEALEQDGEYPGLVAWLRRVLTALHSADLYHRDIHRRNILWCPERQRFSLIDWTWANYVEDAPAATPRPRDASAPRKFAKLDPLFMEQARQVARQEGGAA